MTAFIALGKNGLKRARRSGEKRGGAARIRQREAACADSASGQERVVRRQELSRPREGISQQRLRCERRQGRDSRAADHVHQMAEFGDRARRADSELSRLHEFDRLRRRAHGRDRAGRARHREEGCIRPRLWLHDRQRCDRAHAAEPAQAMVPRQKPRRLLPDGAVHRHGRRSARRDDNCG